MEVKKYYGFDYLRVIGMLFVMWPHLGYNMNNNWNIALLVQKYISIPFGIVQNFGFLGTCIFFLIMGFLLVNKDTPMLFLRKRFICCMFTYWIEMLLFYIVQRIVAMTTTVVTYWENFRDVDWLKCGLLYNYIVTGDTELVNGITWYLVVVICLYVLEFMRKCIKCDIKYWILLTNLSLLVMFLIVPRETLPILPFFAYIGIAYAGLIIGQLVEKSISIKCFCCLIILDFVCTLIGFSQYLPTYFEDGHLISYVYAIMIFSVCLFLEPHFQKSPPNLYITQLSKISYSFYLTHALYGGMTISIVLKYVREYDFVFVCGVLAALLFAFVNYYLIENNVKRLVNCVLLKKYNATKILKGELDDGSNE